MGSSLGTLSIEFANGVDFDPTTGLMDVVRTDPFFETGGLYRVDPETAHSTDIGGTQPLNSTAFDADGKADATLNGLFQGLDSTLYEIDVLTEVEALIGDMGVDNQPSFLFEGTPTPADLSGAAPRRSACDAHPLGRNAERPCLARQQDGGTRLHARAGAERRPHLAASLPVRGGDERRRNHDSVVISRPGTGACTRRRRMKLGASERGPSECRPFDPTLRSASGWSAGVRASPGFAPATNSGGVMVCSDAMEAWIRPSLVESQFDPPFNMPSVHDRQSLPRISRSRTRRISGRGLATVLLAGSTGCAALLSSPDVESLADKKYRIRNETGLYLTVDEDRIVLRGEHEDGQAFLLESLGTGLYRFRQGELFLRADSAGFSMAPYEDDFPFRLAIQRIGATAQQGYRIHNDFDLIRTLEGGPIEASWSVHEATLVLSETSAPDSSERTWYLDQVGGERVSDAIIREPWSPVRLAEQSVVWKDLEKMVRDLPSEHGVEKVRKIYPEYHLFNTYVAGTHHVQGVAYHAGWYYFTHNTRKSESLLVCTNPDTEETREHLIGRYDHPGAIQACNSILVVPTEHGSESEVLFFDLSTPASPPLLDYKLRRPDKKAGAAGLAYHPIHRRHYLIVEYGGSKDQFDLYRSNGESFLSDDSEIEFELIATFDDIEGCQGGAQLAFDESGKLYLVGLYRSDLLELRSLVTGDLGGWEHVVLYEVRGLDDVPELVRIRDRLLSHSVSNIDYQAGFRWGGCIYSDTGDDLEVMGVARTLTYGPAQKYTKVKHWVHANPVTIRNDGWYIADFELSWYRDGRRHSRKNKLTRGHSESYRIPVDATRIHLRAKAIAGKTIFDRDILPPIPWRYRFQGTTLFTDFGVDH